MLKRIFVQNYALIESLTIDWEDGFGVITGETGSGKSILLGALGLILGKRADVSVLRNPKEKCVVEAVFDLKRFDLQPFFEEQDLDYELYTTLRREINSQGKSRAFVNDTPVNLAQLKSLGEQLIDIHSQHETLNLKNNQFQLKLLDDFAGLTTEVGQYKIQFDRYRTLKKTISILEEEILNANKVRDFNEFQINELIEVNPVAGEQESAEQELELLSNVQNIQAALAACDEMLSNSENDVIGQLKLCISALDPVSDMSSTLSELKARLKSAMIELKDVANEVGQESNRLESNPQRVFEIQERLDKIYRLQHKHGLKSIEELISFQNDLQAQLDSHHNREQELESHRSLLVELEAKVQKLAAGISSKRASASSKLEKKINDLLVVLEMKSAEIKIEISRLKEPGEFGIDQVSYLLKSNKGQEFMPIEQVASGGELSRVMLALKSVQSGNSEPPTLILDEIDNGVSGKVAHAMADLLYKMGEDRQLICITHLAQIAARGKSHFKVHKHETEEQTFTAISRLIQDDRLLEIAGMLSGNKTTDAAIENARSLMHLN
jgi:DNA repair protein RecN (Recombination protein N)